MYIPKHYQNSDVRELHAHIDRHPLGAWVTVGSGEIVANHIPFLLDAEKGKFGTLAGHVAKANPVWRALADGNESIVIFQRPEAYVSPSWYPS
ncbi:MAG TPA: FMN-binding negative transcriptional regulator, partial [Rudaea sp.]|nr:FMN-binding negative transcriptional regulator [Rudaea sp.]